MKYFFLELWILVYISRVFAISIFLEYLLLLFAFGLLVLSVYSCHILWNEYKVVIHFHKMFQLVKWISFSQTFWFLRYFWYFYNFEQWSKQFINYVYDNQWLWWFILKFCSQTVMQALQRFSQQIDTWNKTHRAVFSFHWISDFLFFIYFFFVLIFRKCC